MLRASCSKEIHALRSKDRSDSVLAVGGACEISALHHVKRFTAFVTVRTLQRTTLLDTPWRNENIPWMTLSTALDQPVHVVLELPPTGQLLRSAAKPVFDLVIALGGASGTPKTVAQLWLPVGAIHSRGTAIVRQILRCGCRTRLLSSHQCVPAGLEGLKCDCATQCERMQV